MCDDLFLIGYYTEKMCDHLFLIGYYAEKASSFLDYFFKLLVKEFKSYF